MRNRMYGGVRGRKTKVGGKLLRFPPTRFESKFKKHLFFYTLQLVTPSVVAMAVRKEIAICKIVFQVFAFIMFNV